jgi:hypothetical protein
MLHPADFRARLDLAGDGDGSPGPALHPAIVATVLAWGAKFSEHVLFRADRARNGGQGLLAKAVIDRARAVAEVLRVPRVATPENVIACLLLEPVQPRACTPRACRAPLMLTRSGREPGRPVGYGCSLTRVRGRADGAQASRATGSRRPSSTSSRSSTTGTPSS